MSDTSVILAEIKALRADQDRDRGEAETFRTDMRTDMRKVKDALWKEDRGLFARVAANTTARRILTWFAVVTTGSLVGTMVRVFFRAPK
jgi:hypothetical protein